jgi:ethanolamine transporter EutH
MGRACVRRIFLGIRSEYSYLNAGVYVFAIAVYITVIVPMLGTTVNPLDVDTKADSIEAMRVLSAANVIVIVCLGAILTLQVRSYALRRMIGH